ncbi:MAG: T9SS type A sorting domain-containing protein [Bacteroidales bacterium]|nr:T9SS type A sorting domain-containing protein [Bacteroidales bacterium]
MAQTPIPFTETWESGSFETNGWTVSQGSGQCAVVNQGSPGSNWSAGFTLAAGVPAGDSVALLSPWIDAQQATDGLLVLAFDYKLLNPDSTQWPLLKMYGDAGNGWVKLYELTYDASLDWRELKADLPMAKGQQVRLMWVAAKESDTAAGQWFIDNISLAQPQSTPVINLAAWAINQPEAYKAELNWNKPVVNPLAEPLRDSTLSYFNLYLPMYNGMLYQYTGTGVGIFFDNKTYQSSILSEVSFFYKYPPGEFSGRSSFRVQLMNLETRQLVGTFGPFTTSYAQGWQHIPLNLTQMPQVDSLAVLIEPLTEYNFSRGNSNQPGVAFWEDYTYPYQHSIAISLYDTSYILISNFGELIMELTLLTPDGRQTTVSPSSYSVNRWQQSLPLQYLPMATVDSNTTQWFDTQVERGWYSYFVTANYADGSSLNSDTVAVEMPSGQGLVEPSAGLPNVAPNPVQGRVLRLSDANQAVSIKVTDLLGRTIAETTSQTLLVNGLPLPQINTGCFLAHITLANGQTVCRKFVVQ